MEANDPRNLECLSVKPPPFRYRTLPSGRWSRLLHIHPGSHSDPLICDITIFNIDDAPRYDALSYVWGETSELCEITCSGFPKTITASLYRALRRLRSSNRTRTIWADAICIDQTSGTEKQHQVNLMGAIYKSASAVLVHLGEDDNGIAGEAFRVLLEVNALRTKLDELDAGKDSTEVRNSIDALSDGHVQVTKDGGLVLSDRQQKYIRAIFELPWFSRLWQVQ